MLARKQFKKNLNAIHKRMRFSMFNQIQIINYFKSIDQSNSTSINSRKFSLFINNFNSTSRFCSSVNRITKTSQHQHIAIDEISNLKIQQKLKFDVFINNLNSTSRVCFSINQNAEILHIAFEANFTSLIKSTKASNLKIQQKIKIRVSIDSSESKYLVAANIDHINKNIRVETLLTNAKEYNSIKSSIKSIEKFKSIKFNIFINCFNSIFRICFSINQNKIKSLKPFKLIKLFKSLKFAVIISSLNSTFRFSLSVNHDSLISSRINFLRVLINQVIYVSIIRISYRFSYQLAFLSFQTTIHRCRRRSHKHLNIRVETTLKERREIM